MSLAFAVCLPVFDNPLPLLSHPSSLLHIVPPPASIAREETIGKHGLVDRLPTICCAELPTSAPPSWRNSSAASAGSCRILTARPAAPPGGATATASSRTRTASRPPCALRSSVILSWRAGGASATRWRRPSSRVTCPRSVYDSTIEEFKAKLPVWHRYWRVRRKALGLESIERCDIWAPIAERQPVIPYAEAVERIARALAPLGDEYVADLRRGCLEATLGRCLSERGQVLGRLLDGLQGHPSLRENAILRRPVVDEHPRPRAGPLDAQLENLEAAEPDLRRVFDFRGRGRLLLQPGHAEGLPLRHGEGNSIPDRGDRGGHGQSPTAISSSCPPWPASSSSCTNGSEMSAAHALALPILEGDGAAAGRYIEFLSSDSSDYPVETLKKAGWICADARPWRSATESWTTSSTDSSGLQAARRLAASRRAPKRAPQRGQWPCR